ncbi:SDR family oxidoreductase [Actinophytocola sp.]|uniref:SDR family oxidoreductase n=1 Tax=Actinophytocola sp. TaxID=1872138 RepID=UPI002D7E7869|nr:SDR family oxidoreductase [Actinophytocola sp.]HET9137992.1 SDR family oxidoreductase [Actinophytocola sp.]
MGAVVVIGATAGIGLELARHYAEAGREVVLTGRDAGRARAAAKEVGGAATGLGFDLSRPEEIGAALAEVGPVDALVLSAVDRDQNTVAEFDIAAARHLVTLKLVGYAEVVHALRERLSAESGVLLFGGQAKVRPYPGSTTVSTVNAGVEGLVRTLAVELAPVRVNSIHPGIVGDSPYWRDKPAAVLDGVRAGTLTGRLASMADVVAASVFLLENPAINNVSLTVDGGWR